jgi:membrane dipeptidase
MPEPPLRLRVDLHAHPGRCFLAGLPLREGAPAADLDGAVASLRAGGVTAASFATVSDMRVIRPDGPRLRAVRPFEEGEAAADHRRQLDALVALAERPGLRPVLDPTGLTAAHEDGELGVILACEGGDFLDGRLAGVDEAYAAGVRTIQLVHYRVNELGDIQTEDPVHGGLTSFGGRIIEEMNRLGMIVDLAHAPWSVVRDALEVSRAPVMVSHSHLAPRDGEAHPRLLSEEHARAIADAGGVIGAWPAGVVLETFEDYLDEIVRLVDLVGAAHVGVGTDMDGNYQPVMSSYEEFDALEAGLAGRGLSEEQLDLVLGASFLRLFERVVEARD